MCIAVVHSNRKFVAALDHNGQLLPLPQPSTLEWHVNQIAHRVNTALAFS